MVLCSACAAPSLRYKTEVNRLVAQGDFQTAAATVEAKRSKMYARKDSALAYLDQAALLHDAAQIEKSDDLFARAQDRIEELYTRSATIEKTLLKGEVIDRLLYHNPANDQKSKTVADIPFYAKQQRILLADCGRINPEDINEYIASPSTGVFVGRSFFA